MNVAAGINDTDAVNVAQLKQVAGSAGGSANLIAGDGIKLVKGTDGSWTISTNFENSGSDEVTYKDVTNTGDTTNTDSGTTSTQARRLSSKRNLRPMTAHDKPWGTIRTISLASRAMAKTSRPASVAVM